MAGAISAGAYTAGVMDYLLETLENWQKAKDLNENSKIPKHEVVIDVLSGASAGGMTAALTAAAIQEEFEHITKEDVDNQSDKLTKNPLYHSWVNLTDEHDNDMMNQMLSLDDIKNNNNEVYSIFNSRFIKTIAERHINKEISGNNYERPYFADDLEIFATLTNLRGISFYDKFNSGGNTKMHRMTKHLDLAHFKLSDNEEYEEDGRIPLNFHSQNSKNKNILMQSAMSTGAFPLGLEPRIIKREGKYILDNKYINIRNQKDINAINRIDGYETLNIDGGTINNDPYIITNKILNDRINKNAKDNEIQTDINNFEQSILMIDPFPNHSDLPKSNYKPLKPLKFIIPKILSAILEELRMKHDVMQSAYGTKDYTKYLIIPSRSGADTYIENHIACGSFGGFGGFFSKKFREHDFLLGRRNCQKFLRDHYSIPVEVVKDGTEIKKINIDHPILKFGYSEISNKDIYDKYICKENGKHYLPLIPDVRVAEENGKTVIKYKGSFEEGKPEYPSIKLSYLLSLESLAKKRFNPDYSSLTDFLAFCTLR